MSLICGYKKQSKFSKSITGNVSQNISYVNNFCLLFPYFGEVEGKIIWECITTTSSFYSRIQFDVFIFDLEMLIVISFVS